MALLFEPLTIRSVTLRNRIAVSPMCEYSSIDGFANDWHLVHLGSRAVGGAGLLITEACAVSPEGRITPYDLGIWKEAHIPALKRITQFIESQGAVPGIQLAHAGRKASCTQPWKGGTPLGESEGGWVTVAPSAISFKEGGQLPEALSQEAMQKVVADFRMAAQRSVEAGFKVMEIHAAHGYLLHQFYSPLGNFRTDDYGGSFENRIRLLLDVVKAVQSVWPAELPLFVRISATDWVENGWGLADSVKLCQSLKEMGVDLIDCSSGGIIGNVSISLKPGYQVPFASRIKNEVNILTGCVGLITKADQAEKILEDKEADIIFMARELLRNPYFPLQAAKLLNQDIEWPVQYQRAK